MNNDNASHILVIPAIVAWLLYGGRKSLTEQSYFDPYPGLAVASLALLVFSLSLWGALSWVNDRLMFRILSLILLIIAGFLVSFGRNAAKTAWFSLAFLAFAIPCPEVFLNGIIHLLQSGSAAVAEWIFRSLPMTVESVEKFGWRGENSFAAIFCFEAFNRL